MHRSSSSLSSLSSSSRSQGHTPRNISRASTSSDSDHSAIAGNPLTGLPPANDPTLAGDPAVSLDTTASSDEAEENSSYDSDVESRSIFDSPAVQQAFRTLGTVGALGSLCLAAYLLSQRSDPSSTPQAPPLDMAGQLQAFIRNCTGTQVGEEQLQQLQQQLTERVQEAMAHNTGPSAAAAVNLSRPVDHGAVTQHRSLPAPGIPSAAPAQLLREAMSGLILMTVLHLLGVI